MRGKNVEYDGSDTPAKVLTELSVGMKFLVSSKGKGGVTVSGEIKIIECV